MTRTLDLLSRLLPEFAQELFPPTSRRCRPHASSQRLYTLPPLRRTADGWLRFDKFIEEFVIGAWLPRFKDLVAMVFPGVAPSEREYLAVIMAWLLGPQRALRDGTAPPPAPCEVLYDLFCKFPRKQWSDVAIAHGLGWRRPLVYFQPEWRGKWEGALYEALSMAEELVHHIGKRTFFGMLTGEEKRTVLWDLPLPIVSEFSSPDPEFTKLFGALLPQQELPAGSKQKSLRPGWLPEIAALKTWLANFVHHLPKTDRGGAIFRCLEGTTIVKERRPFLAEVLVQECETCGKRPYDPARCWDVAGHRIQRTFSEWKAVNEQHYQLSQEWFRCKDCEALVRGIRRNPGGSGEHPFKRPKRCAYCESHNVSQTRTQVWLPVGFAEQAALIAELHSDPASQPGDLFSRLRNEHEWTASEKRVLEYYIANPKDPPNIIAENTKTGIETVIAVVKRVKEFCGKYREDESCPPNEKTP